MKKINKKTSLVITIIALFAIISRLWLLASSNWRIIIESYYDSHLQINEAISLISGNYLGAYSKLTLCKNISYPIFLFILHFLHIPYYLGIGLLIITSAIVFIKAIKPICDNKIIKLIIFIFILFNPVGFNQEALYPYRNALIPWIVLIIVSCIAGIYLRKDKKTKEILPYGIIGMVGTGFYWLLREDSIWFLPFILVSFLVTLYFFIREKYDIKTLIKKSIVSALPMLGIILSVLLVSSINYYVYGVFATNDRTSSYEAKVLGQLVMIDDGADLNKDVWVSKKAINLAKKASPTFAKLDLTPFDAWPKYGDYSIWALRDSVENRGYYKDGKTTNNLYKKIYKELKQAYKDKKLKKKKAIKLSDTSGVFSKEEIIKPIPIMFHSLYNHAIYKFDKVSDESIDNREDKASIEKYEILLKINLSKTTKEIIKETNDYNIVLENYNLIRSLRYNKIISNLIILLYRITGLILLIVSLITYIYLIIKKIKKKTTKLNNDVIIIMTGILLTVFLNSYLVGLWGVGFKLTADATLFLGYTTAQTILVGIFEILALLSIKNKI